MPKEIGDRDKNTYRLLYNRIDRNNRINYLCTDRLSIYKYFRYESFNDNKYIPKDIYKVYNWEEEKKYNNNINNNINNNVININNNNINNRSPKIIKDRYSNLNNRDTNKDLKHLTKHIANKKENKD